MVHKAKVGDVWKLLKPRVAGNEGDYEIFGFGVRPEGYRVALGKRVVDGHCTNMIIDDDDKPAAPERWERLSTVDPKQAYIQAAEMCPKDLNPVGWRAAVMSYWENHRPLFVADACGNVTAEQVCIAIRDCIFVPPTKDCAVDECAFFGIVKNAYHGAIKPHKAPEGKWTYRYKR